MVNLYDEDICISNKESYEYDRECYRINYRHWLEWKFYWQVMTYLNHHRPDELMREEFRANCEAIYEKDEAEYKAYNITYDSLYNSHEMQSILEKWNDCFILPEDEEQA